jgi:hypothetical protein
VIFPFFEWLESTGAADWLRSSIWGFPVIQAIHLLGLCLLGGAILVVDLRMFGVGLRSTSIADLIRYARPWMLAAIALLVITGILMLLPAAAVRYYANTSFWIKMSTLPAALLVTLTAREWMARTEVLEASARTRLVGALSIALWFTVAAAGRWIGFS